LNPIRPNLPSAQPTPARPAAEARAAQRAFFEAALGKAEAVAAPRAQIPAVKITPIQTDAPAPQRILRPGSLIDIKV